MLFVIMQMMAGQFFVPAAGDNIKDVNGVTLAVGDTVKLVAVITAINVTDSHFGTIQVAPAHPNGWGSVPLQSGGSNPQSPNFLVPDQTKIVKTYGFEGIQLVKGS